MKSKDSSTSEVRFNIEEGNEEGIQEQVDTQHPPLFCQLSELRLSPKDQSRLWKETARYVRFEELVEEGADRWSKPHVASLCYTSLHKVQRLIRDGVVCLDTPCATLDQLITLIENKLREELHLDGGQVTDVSRALRVPHKHKKEVRKPVASMKTGMQYGALSKRASSASLTTRTSEANLARGRSSGDLPRSESKILEEENLRNLDFLRHLTRDTLVANILTGPLEGLRQPVSVLVRFDDPCLLGNMSEVTVATKFFFLYLQPEGAVNDTTDVGRSIGTLFADESFRETAYDAKTKEEWIQGIQEFIDRAVLIPRGEWDPSIRLEPPQTIPPIPKKTAEGKPEEKEEEEHGDPTLQRTGRFFGGLIADIKRKLPFYPSDITDGFHFQCVASIVFLYIACLTPIITFGGLLGKSTKNYMAAMEGILSGAVTGLAFALFAGQPLNIVGSTGPMLVFEQILYQLCEDQDWVYLTFRVWVGIWVAVFLMIIVAFDLSALVRYITRFSEEGFSSLISIIFIYEAVEKLLHLESEYAINKNADDLSTWDCSCVFTNTTPDNQTWSWNRSALTVPSRKSCEHDHGELVGAGCHTVPDVFLFSIIICLGTYVVSMVLKMFKFAPFFPSIVRQVVSDFAVILGVILMTLTDFMVGLNTPKLEVPAEFKPTRSDRGWLISPFAGKNPWWTTLAASVPAILATILIFLDQQITAVIVNRKQHKLKKGAGYHLDLFVLSLMIALTSFLGLPWFVAATVQALTHIFSLRKESEASAPGEKPEFLGIREQRVTFFFVSLLTGLSVFMTPVFKLIPMPVLYGVFLYMGFTSLAGVQFIDRLLLLFMPEKHQPDYPYLRQVRTWRVHVYTIIQLACLAGLWVIKTTKSISIFFPVMILVMCFVRKLMECFFSPRELKAIDHLLPGRHLRKSLVEKDEKEAIIFGKDNLVLKSESDLQLGSSKFNGPAMQFYQEVDITDENKPSTNLETFPTKTAKLADTAKTGDATKL